MIEHEGIVIAVEKDSFNVRIEQQAACGSCSVKGHCMASESKVKEILCHSKEKLQIGDKVNVTITDSMGWLAVFLAFVLPFVILLLSVWLLGFVIQNEAVVGTVALCLLVPYFVVLRFYRARLNNRFSFVATKKLD